MGCNGSKGAASGIEAAKVSPSGLALQFIDGIVIDRVNIEDFDHVFESLNAPLRGIIDANNKLQSSVEQLVLASSAAMGGFRSEAIIKDGKLSLEIFKPPEKEEFTKKRVCFATPGSAASQGHAKPVLIAIVEGGAATKGTGVTVKEHELYNTLTSSKFGQDWTTAVIKMSKQIDILNKVVSESGLKIKVKADRLAAPMETPTETGDLAKYRSALSALNSFNAAYLTMKMALARASLENGLGIKEIVKQIMFKIRAAIGELAPKVNVDMAGLAKGELYFDIGVDEYLNIEDYLLEKSELIPPLLKKAWYQINGRDGLVNCMKEVAAALKDLKPLVEVSVESMRFLPTDSKEIAEKAKAAKLKPSEVSGAQLKMKRNLEQLSRASDIVQNVFDQLNFTAQQLEQALAEFASSAEELVTV